MVQCVLANIAAHPAVTRGGGLTLKCDDGEVSVLCDVFVVASPLIEELLSTGSTSVKVSGSTKEEWLLVISQLYPIVPRPELSLPQLQQVLPVVHKYNFSELLQFVSSRLATELPSTWSLDPAAPGYIIKWLVTAEQLQLDALKQAALEGLKKQPGQQIRTQMANKALDADLLHLSLELMLEAWRVSLQSHYCPACVHNCTCPAVNRRSPACAAQCPNLRRCVVQVVKAHPSVVKRGEVTLECDDGGLSVLRDVFVVSSPWMADLLGEGCTSVKARGRWDAQLPHVASQPKPSCAPLVPVVFTPGVRQHQGGVAPGHQPALPHCAPSRAEPAAAAESSFCSAQELLQYVSSRLATQLPSSWSLDPSAPGYIIKWLVTAEQLQLDALKQAALEGLKTQAVQRIKMQMATKALDADLLRQLYPIVPRPELNLQQLQQVLPVIHKHSFPELLQFVESRLATQLPSSWSLDFTPHGYIIKWLIMAEQLQLDALKQAALEGAGGTTCDLLMQVIKANVELGSSCQASSSAHFQLAAREGLLKEKFTLTPEMVLGTKAIEIKWVNSLPAVLRLWGVPLALNSGAGDSVLLVASWKCAEVLRKGLETSVASQLRPAVDRSLSEPPAFGIRVGCNAYGCCRTRHVAIAAAHAVCYAQLLLTADLATPGCCPSVRPTAPHCLGSSAYGCCRTRQVAIAAAHAVCYAQLLLTADLATPGCCPSVRPTAPHCLGCYAYGCCRTRQVAIAAAHAVCYAQLLLTADLATPGCCPSVRPTAPHCLGCYAYGCCRTRQVAIAAAHAVCYAQLLLTADLATPGCCPSVRPTAPHCLGCNAYGCCQTRQVAIAAAHAVCYAQLLLTADLATPGCCPSVRPTAPHCLGCNAYGCCQTRQVAIAAAHAVCYAQLLLTADLATPGCCPSVRPTAPHCLGCYAYGCCRTRHVAIAAAHAVCYAQLLLTADLATPGCCPSVRPTAPHCLGCYAYGCCRTRQVAIAAAHAVCYAQLLLTADLATPGCCPSVRPTAPHCLGSSAYGCCRTRQVAIAAAHAVCYAQLLLTADLATPGCCPSVRPTAPHCLGCNAYGCCRTRQVAIAAAHAACYAQLLLTADLVTLGCCPSVWHTAPHCLGACGFCRTRCVAIAAAHASTFLTLAARPTPLVRTCAVIEPSVVQVVAAHPSVVKGGGLTLECDDGGLPVSRDVFALSSPLMADLLGEGSTSVKVRRDTMQWSSKEEWLLVISQLYPIVPHPELSLQQLQQVLPVVHKYNFSELLQYVCSRLATELPSSWSLDPAAPGYIIKWLVTAEQLQLDALKDAAMEGLKKQPEQRLKRQLATKVMHADLLRLSPELMLEAWRVVAEAKICYACVQDCTCEEKRRFAAYCH
ncbi:hypothetical protein QJQ45_030322, partial [Haematococcus lacustris]